MFIKELAFSTISSCTTRVKSGDAASWVTIIKSWMCIIIHVQLFKLNINERIKKNVQSKLPLFVYRYISIDYTKICLCSADIIVQYFKFSHL